MFIPPMGPDNGNQGLPPFLQNLPPEVLQILLQNLQGGQGGGMQPMIPPGVQAPPVPPMQSMPMPSSPAPMSPPGPPSSGGGGGPHIGPTMRARMAARDAAGGAPPQATTYPAPLDPGSERGSRVSYGPGEDIVPERRGGEREGRGGPPSGPIYGGKPPQAGPSVNSGPGSGSRPSPGGNETSGGHVAGSRPGSNRSVRPGNRPDKPTTNRPSTDSNASDSDEGKFMKHMRNRLGRR